MSTNRYNHLPFNGNSIWNTKPVHGNLPRNTISTYGKPPRNTISTHGTSALNTIVSTTLGILGHDTKTHSLLLSWYLTPLYQNITYILGSCKPSPTLYLRVILNTILNFSMVYQNEIPEFHFRVICVMVLMVGYHNHHKSLFCIFYTRMHTYTRVRETKKPILGLACYRFILAWN